jgi:uncharacterized membrane protein (DUF485 family)
MAEHMSRNKNTSEQRKSNIGVWMTLLYSIVYGGFVVVSVFQPAWMGANAIFGLNLAVAYGLGLILIAVIFAMIYNQLVRLPKSSTASQQISEPDQRQEED